MLLEQAIKTAMDVEAEIRNLYRQAYEACDDSAGKRFFAMLRDDEQYHYDYLGDRLAELQEAGQIQFPEINVNLPTASEVTACLNDAKKNMAVEDRGVIQQMLSNALKVEARTSQFYAEMVSESSGMAKKMFAKFLEIEDGHVSAVQAELDFVMNTGYWFDIKEFDME